MSQGFRDMLANRRFAIPLIALLALCFIGLLGLGIIFVMGLGGNGDVAQATATPEATATVGSGCYRSGDGPARTHGHADAQALAHLVPLGTVTTVAETPEATEEATTAPNADNTDAPTVEPTATEQAQATEEATSEPDDNQETVTPEPEEDELAQTGLGWGLVLFSGAGLAMLAVAARRLRLAG